MGECYEIIPGESVGPFRLGMKREEIEGLNILPMETSGDESGTSFPAVGVRVFYDEAGTCTQIEARVFGEGTASFVLAGRPVNNVSEAEAQALFSTISPEIRFSSGGFILPSAGLRTFKWEATDDFLYSILVKFPEGRERPAPSAPPAPEPAEPDRLMFELGDQQAVFVSAGDGRYAVELDGRRRLLRVRRQTSDVSENGDRRPYEPTQSEGETANIDTILGCLALGAERRPLARGVELSATEVWGHFRQRTFFKVSITVAEDAVEIDEDIRVQDDSYY